MKRASRQTSMPTNRAATWQRALGFVHIAVGLWLMYLTIAATLNFARGFNLPL